MNAKRLLKLADHLDTVLKKTFDMNYWKCGSVACAFGHACSIPSFRRAGLHLEYNGRDCDGVETFIPAYQGHSSTTAARAFFDLSPRDANELFMPWGYKRGRRGPKSVAKTIRAFVKRKQRDAERLSTASF